MSETIIEARTETDAKTSARFDLQKQPSADSIQAIFAITNGKIQLPYIAVMLAAIQQRKYTWFSYVEAPVHDVLLKQIIGKNGLHLKTFTTKYGVDVIWHDRTSNRFLLWGAKLALVGALHALNRQIKRFTVKYAEDLAVLLTLDHIRLREADEIEHDPFLPQQKKFKYE